MNKLLFLGFSFLFILFNISFANSTDEIKAVVQKWNELHNTRETEQFKILYSPTVLYYGRYDSRLKCYNSKRKNLSPRFSQEIITPIKITHYSSGIAKCNFTKRVINKQIVKEYECYLLVQNINGNYYVTGEGDIITDNRLNLKLNLGEPLNKSGKSGSIITICCVLIAAGGGAFYYKKKRQEKGMFDIEETTLQQETIEDEIIPAKDKLEEPDLITRIKSEVLKQLKEGGFEESSPQKKGFAFESYVVDLFREQYFSLIEWQSDKYHNGKFPLSSLNPDLVYKFKTNYKSCVFAVECKWRAGFQNGIIEIANERQLGSYRKFQKHNRVPVFVLIGMGGEPSDPESLFIIPLEELRSGIINEFQLKKYYRHRKGYIYFNIDKMILE